ncbi:MAG TPA: hypothetical protein VIV27_07880 [Halioglobus sp.]
MYKRTKNTAIILGIAIAAAAPAFAKKPETPPGNGATQKATQELSASANAHTDHHESHNYFNDDRTAVIRNYYARSRNSGNCPPGLAKKNNGCQPPGQAKKWRSGEHFPHDVMYYDLPSALIAELGRTPDGAKIIQTGTAILLISAGTGLILDALDIED